MSANIKAGDTVIVLRGHCKHVMAGLPKKVLGVSSFVFDGQCYRCGGQYRYAGMFAEVQHDGHTGWLPFPWVQKLDDADAHEGVEREAEVMA